MRTFPNHQRDDTNPMKLITSSKHALQVGELQDYVTKPGAGDWRRRNNPFRLATLCQRDCRCVLLRFGPPHSSLCLCDQISVILSTSYRSRLIVWWPLHCYHYHTASQNSRVLSPPETWFPETEYVYLQLLLGDRFTLRFLFLRTWRLPALLPWWRSSSC